MKVKKLIDISPYIRAQDVYYQLAIHSGGLFDRWAGFWRSWTNRVALFKNIEVDYLLRAARHTP